MSEDQAVRAVPGRIGWHYCIIKGGERPKGTYAYSSDPDERALARFLDCGLWLDEDWEYLTDSEFDLELMEQVMGFLDVEDLIDLMEANAK